MYDGRGLPAQESIAALSMNEAAQTSTSSHMARDDTHGHRLLLGMIVLVGFVLRVLYLPQLEFMHDELSALSRLSYSSFVELIEHGILPDGHPAGVQVFLYYWTGWVGTSPILVKLPSVLLGTASIPLLFSIGRQWFSSAAGLVAAALLASLQYPILYSQLSRPYAFGLFFSLLMVFGWSQIVLRSAGGRRAYVYFVLGLVGCAYTHYFAHLLGVIVGGTGLLMVDRGQRARYAGAIAVALLLYLPHLPIFFGQLQTGGLLWLARPRPYFVVEHFSFIFMHSIWPVGVLISLFVAGRFAISRGGTADLKLSRLAICFLWFLLPIGIGYMYSVLRAPVLQHSVLLFSVPYLFLVVGAVAQYVDRRLLLAGVFILMVVNTCVLITDRQHYSLMSHQPHSQFYELTESFLTEVSDTSTVAILFNENPVYLDRYFGSATYSYSSLHGGGLSNKAVSRVIADSSNQYIILGNIPRKWLPEVRAYYPYLQQREVGFTFEYYIYGKTPSAEPLSDLLHEASGEVILQSSGDSTLLVDLKVPSEIGNYDFLEVVVSTDTRAEMSLVQHLHNGAKGREVRARLRQPSTASDQSTAVLTSRLIHHIAPADKVSDYCLQLYVKHDSLSEPQQVRYSISFYEGNELVYGLYKDI